MCVSNGFNGSVSSRWQHFASRFPRQRTPLLLLCVPLLLATAVVQSEGLFAFRFLPFMLEFSFLSVTPLSSTIGTSAAVLIAIMCKPSFPMPSPLQVPFVGVPSPVPLISDVFSDVIKPPSRDIAFELKLTSQVETTSILHLNLSNPLFFESALQSKKIAPPDP